MNTGELQPVAAMNTRSRAWLAELGIERETVRGAYGPGRWRGEIHEVAAGGLNDAGARISAAEVPVAVMGQQDGIAQPPCGVFKGIVTPLRRS